MFNITQVQNPLNPIQILKTGAEEEKAETARLSSFVGAIAIGDLIKSTLGMCVIFLKSLSLNLNQF